MYCAEIQNKDNIIYSQTNFDMNVDKSLGEYLFEFITKHGNKIALIDSETGQQESYEDFLNRVISLAQALQTKGITRNDVVAYCCSNNMDYAVVILASIFIGTKFTAFDNIGNDTETAYYIKLVKPSIIFCDDKATKLIELGLIGAGITCDIVTFGESEKYMSMKYFMKIFKSENEFQIDKSTSLKDTCCILFTSGTTGLGKGAKLTGYGLLEGSISAFSNRIKDKTMFTLLSSTLTSWTSNLYSLIITIVNGGTRIIYNSFKEDTFMKVLADFKVNITFLSQFMVIKLMAYPECRNYDTSALRFLVFGGSDIRENSINFIQKVFPEAGLINAYGSTELGVFMFSCPTDKFYFDSNGTYTVGSPKPGIKFKITDLTTGEPVGPNIQGELRVKYEGCMNGYVNDPKRTAGAFDKDYYYLTGDLAYYAENHLFYVTGRLKKIFKYEGQYVSLSIIEDQLMLHPEIKEVGVITIPNEEGEVPVACIKLKDGASAKEEDFVEYIKEKLSRLYHLRGGVKFVDSIPKTTRGKIKRYILREQILEDLQK